METISLLDQAQEESYLTEISKTWAFPVAITATVVNILALPALTALIWKRRDHFPLNSTPPFLLLSTQVGANLYVAALTHGLLGANSLPCWLHLILEYGRYFPFFCGTMVQLFRIWFLYRLQESKAKGKKNWFARYANLSTEGVLKRIFVASGLLLFLVPVLQLSLNDAETLASPMASLECVNEKAQTFASICWWLVIGGNVLFGYLVKDIDDAFSINTNWKKIVYFFVMGAPLNAMAMMSPNLRDAERSNAFSMGQLAYVGASFAYMFFASIEPIRKTYAAALEEKMQMQRLRGGYDTGSSSSSSSDKEKAAVITSPKELRAALEDPVLCKEFLGYLMREFACRLAVRLHLNASIAWNRLLPSGSSSQSVPLTSLEAPMDIDISRSFLVASAISPSDRLPSSCVLQIVFLPLTFTTLPTGEGLLFVNALSEIRSQLPYFQSRGSISGGTEGTGPLPSSLLTPGLQKCLENLSNNFITLGAPYEINISSELRNKILKRQREIGTIPTNLSEVLFALDEAEQDVLATLMDSYKRFRRQDYAQIRLRRPSAAPAGIHGKISPENNQKGS